MADRTRTVSVRRAAMSLLFDAGALDARRRIAAGPLAPLARSLAADLEPVLARELYFPRDKALLSRQGGRCERDGTLLDFDPFQPRLHRCSKCGTVYEGALHDRFWIYWYQLWLAERAVHAAALSALGIDNRFSRLAADILDGYAERYASYPNSDNVLGPTRLFFSTYLESIWLLQICIAVDLIQSAQPELADRVRDRIVEPSRAIIAEYDEGGSNRQVWNDAALLASARLLGDDAGAEQAVYGGSGIAEHLAGGLLSDGTWYEGENYHLFAHRGLWYGVTMAERAGLELPDALTDRFQRGFSTPFATALPDFTLPSRRDSQYAISLRQWRIAEHCELGVSRRADEVLLGALRRMYGDDVPRRPTGRDRSAADVERNAEASALTRADLGWRALLFARPELPLVDVGLQPSALLDAQGIAVFRRDAGRLYAALDYGHSGGGHGHPDRLNLLLAVGDTRWLDDFGTGSYVDPSLHWYRSTLAHNTLLLNGRSQMRVHGDLAAYDERADAGWITATADGIGPGARIARTLVVMPTYAIDCVQWESDEPTTVDLPLHVDASIASGATAPIRATLAGGDGTEDGFRFVRDTTVQRAAGGTVIVAHARANGERLDLFATSSGDTEWWRATAPGAPGRGDHSFRIVRAAAQDDGAHWLVWSWARDVTAVEFGETIRVTLADATVHIHTQTDDGWHVDLTAGATRSSVDLGGLVDPSTDDALMSHDAPLDDYITIPLRGRSLLVALGEAHYRRSEQSWPDAGEPSASVTLGWSGRSLDLTVEVERSDLTFAPANAENPYDNEAPDVNGDGVQLFVRTPRGLSGWVLVPDPASPTVRIRAVEGWTAPHELSARWERWAYGYRMFVSLPGNTPPEAIDVVINEMPRGRERRRGQLVMSGAAGEFTYLRGDRHEAGRLITLRLADD